MSECVVRMEMPTENIVCELNYYSNSYYSIGYRGEWRCTIMDKRCDHNKNGEFPSWCPIICQLPEGHGRLGDLNRLEKIADAVRIDAMQKGHDTNPYWLLEDIIAQAKTIVPAERSANEHKQKKYTNWIGEEMVEQQIDKDVSRFADGEWWKEVQE